MFRCGKLCRFVCVIYVTHVDYACGRYNTVTAGV